LKKNFETALCGAIENGSFQNRQKNQKSSGLRLLSFFGHCFVDGNNYSEEKR